LLALPLRGVDLIDSIRLAVHTLTAGKPCAKKARHYGRGSFVNHSNLTTVMMMTMMTTGVGVGRNNRSSQNDQCDGGEKQCAQLHKWTPSQAAILANGL
jgi:hypothetical protein